MGGASYLYNGLGQRVQQTVGALVSQYVIDPQPGLWQVVQSVQGANTTRYVHGPMGLLGQQNPDTTWRWPVMDGLGSVRGVVDSALTAQESRLYSPYGELYGNTGSSQTVFGFTGEPTDSNGLVQLRARYYNPTLGMFPSLDEMESDNRYQYASSDPINRLDPSGLFDWFSFTVEEGDTLRSIALEGGARENSYGGYSQQSWARFGLAVVALNGTIDRNPESAIRYVPGGLDNISADPLKYYRLLVGRKLRIPNDVPSAGMHNIVATGQSNQRRRGSYARAALGTVIGGYIEGVSAGITIGMNNQQPYNIEVVYNFATFQRIVFEYNAQAVSLTAAATAGGGIYVGHIEGFVPNTGKADDYSTFIDQYGGPFTFSSFGLGKSPESGGMEIAAGAGVGVVHFHTPLGATSAPVYGNNIYLSVGLGVSVHDLTPVGTAYYKPTDKRKHYIKGCQVDRNALTQDILSGADSPHNERIPGVMDLPIGVPIITQAYRIAAAAAADIAAKNYNDRHVSCGC
jgi:RHS repeat-associated protein